MHVLAPSSRSREGGRREIRNQGSITSKKSNINMSQNKKIKKKNAKKVKIFTFFKNMDPELKSILIKCAGGLVLMIAVFTFVSMLSYLFTWSVDKDLLMNAGRDHLVLHLFGHDKIVNAPSGVVFPGVEAVRPPRINIFHIWIKMTEGINKSIFQK